MPTYDFQRSPATKVPTGRQNSQAAILDLRGLDLVTPADLMKEGRSSYAKNFRLYAQQTDDRQVAVSSRKGPGFYLNPLNETVGVVNTATTDASTAAINIVTNIHEQPFTATNSDRLTKIELNIGNPNGASGPVLVRIYTNVDGRPGALLAESSILNGDIAETPDWEVARFIKAPKLTNGSVYWIVVSMQDDGLGQYVLATTTAGTKAYVTNGSLFSGVLQTYAINFRTYTTAEAVMKGAYRFARDNGNNVTIMAIGTSMYKVDEANNSLVLITDGLSGSATEYSFTNADNKVFWVNSFDQLRTWDGTLTATNGQLMSNGTFETNTTGWAATGGGTGNAITQDATEFHSGTKSMKIAASSGTRSAQYAMAVTKNKEYEITYWAKAASGTVNITMPTATFVTAPSAVTMTNSWVQSTVRVVAKTTDIAFRIQATADIYIDDVSIKETGIEIIVDDELPILSQILMHKDRLFGVSAADPNRLVWSEAPGNPPFEPDGTTPTDPNEQWYYAWLSTSFWYVPRPHNGSPITGIVSFQDALIIFTADRKYVFTGYDKGSFFLREATGARGAISRRGITSDENRIYFVSDDGLYEYNGSSDKKISQLVAPLFDGTPNKEKITPVIWKSKVRWYMASVGSNVNDTVLLWNKDIEEWEYDTDTFIDTAIYYGDADDEQELVEISSLAPFAVKAEQGYNSLGAPIDFEYDFPYSSMGSPAQRKKIVSYYPLLQGVDSTFALKIAMDKDFQNSPRVKDVILTTNGNTLGSFKFGDGTLFGGATSFKMHRLKFSGYGNYWQMRIYRKAVNNRVAFSGAQFTYKAKRI